MKPFSLDGRMVSVRKIRWLLIQSGISAATQSLHDTVEVIAPHFRFIFKRSVLLVKLPQVLELTLLASCKCSSTVYLVH